MARAKAKKKTAAARAVKRKRLPEYEAKRDFTVTSEPAPSGLSHAGATQQMMYAYLTRTAARFGRGDLHALEARGSKLGCVTGSSPRVTARVVNPRVAAIRVAP